MRIKNPFSSSIFSNVWVKHFASNNTVITFPEFKGISFVKLKKIPLYSNVGKTHTKGIYYSLSNTQFISHKKNVYLIYDVPQHFNIKTQGVLKLFTSKQYPGFLIHLYNYENLNDYLIKTFRKSSRYKLNKYKKRLELCFDIDYKFFFGEISKKDYNYIFSCFKDLLQKRFQDKQTINNNLNPEEWNFYNEVTFPLILEKKAALFVIYSNNIPVGITLIYFSESIIFDAITVFDIDYAKFHLGSVTIMKLIEWGIQNEYKILDFSKGYFDYKVRWSDLQYNYEYQIYYNSASIISSAIAIYLKIYFDFKQFLRTKKINQKLHRITFKFKNRRREKKLSIKHEFSNPSTVYETNELTHLDYNKKKYSFLKIVLFDFLYLNQEKLSETELYVISKNKYLIKSVKNIKEVCITEV